LRGLITLSNCKNHATIPLNLFARFELAETVLVKPVAQLVARNPNIAAALLWLFCEASSGFANHVLLDLSDGCLEVESAMGACPSGGADRAGCLTRSRGRCSGRISSPSHRMIARSMMFRSSRMLPGQ